MAKHRKKWLGLGAGLLGAAGLVFAGLELWPQPEPTVRFPKPVMRRAEALQEQILSFDSHIDIATDYGTEGNEADKDSGTQFDLVKAGRGRLSGAALTIWAWPEFWAGDNVHRPTPGFVEAARNEQEIRYRVITGIAKDFPNRAGIAYSPADFRKLAREGKFAIVLSMLNAYPLGEDLWRLDEWAARGVRLFGFSYVGNNAWADSSRPMPFFGDSPDALGGLSELGRQAVGKLNDLGVIIDVSQMSTSALTQVAQLSRAPIVASHSGLRGLVDIPRNLSDRELQLIKGTGGVVQLVGFSSYLKPFTRETITKVNELRAGYGLPDVANLHQAGMPADPVFSVWPEARFGEYAGSLYAILEEEPKASVSDFGDAIDYAVKKIGVDHVGISSDFNDGGGLRGWKNVAETKNVTAELIQRGYSDQDIAKLWGGNFLRVWEQVQKHAQAQDAALLTNVRPAP
jgi:membrane dipeptidase